MINVKKGATEHLQPMQDDGYVMTDARFDWLNGWTHITMLLNETRQSLDLSEKYNFLQTIDRMEQVLLAHALFRNAIVSYGKCYASASPGKVTLDRNAIFRGKDSLKAKHERMIEIRNSFAAHNGQNDIDTATMAVKESMDEFLIRHTYTLAMPLNEYDDYRQVLDHVCEFVLLSLNKRLDQMEKRLGKRIRLE